MRLPLSFIIVSLVFLFFGLLMWLVSATPVFFQPHGDKAGLFVTPGVMGVVAVVLLFQLKSALGQSAGGAGAEDDYGVFKGLQNTDVVRAGDTQNAATPTHETVLNLVLILLLMISVGPLAFYVWRLFYPVPV